MAPQTPSSNPLPDNPTASGPRKLQKWSSKDKNDIYERRQSGELWHSIEKDYPNRTGNALRLKYSEVKAQKTASDDKPVRRRRKRRCPARYRSAVNQPDSDPSSSELSDADDDTTITSYHPQSSSRSTPDPAGSEERILPIFPNLQAGDTAKSPSIGVRSEEPDTNLTNVADGGPMTDAISVHGPFKKQKVSTEPSRSLEPSLAGRSTDLPAQHSTPVVGSSKLSTNSADDATISSLFSTLEDTIKAKIAAVEAEKDRRQALFDAASGRANRRANEAAQQLQDERKQHLAITKSNEQRLVEHENAKLAAEQSARDAQAIIKSKDERLAELESIRLAAVDGEQDLKAINDDLRNTILKKDSELAAKEQQLKLYDQLREQIYSEISKLTEVQWQNEVVLGAIKEHQAKFRRVWALLSTEVSVSKLQNYVDELKLECEGIQPWLDVVATRWQAATDAFATFRTQFTLDGSDGSSFDTGARAGHIGDKDSVSLNSGALEAFLQ